MKIEYRAPVNQHIGIAASVQKAGEKAGDTVESVLCTYTPEPVDGAKIISAGHFKAIGDSGRVEQAEVVFDLRRKMFVLRPKRLIAGGFDFDKPEGDGDGAAAD